MKALEGAAMMAATLLAAPGNSSAGYEAVELQ
jgi:hypothetical protein